MKKLIMLFVFTLVSGLNFTSCTSDNESSSSSSSIVGKWNFSKFTTTVSGVTSPEMDWADNEPGCPKNYVEFKTDGVFNGASYSGSTCVLDISSGTWVQSGSTVTLTLGTEVTTFQVVSVTSSTLKIKTTETDSGVTYTLNVTFTKA